MATLRELAAPYWPLFTAAGARYGVPAELLAAIGYQESRYNPNAFNPESGSNPSVGLMQISVPTALALGFKGSLSELYQPALSVELAAKLLRDNLARIRRDAPGLPARELEDRAIAAYNAGWSKVRPGDAPRTPAGVFVNLTTYVAPVRRYLEQLRGAIAPSSSPAPSPLATSAPVPSSSSSPAPFLPSSSIPAFPPGAAIAALILAGLILAALAGSPRAVPQPG